MEIPEGDDETVLVHLDALDNFFDSFLKYNDTDNKRFQLSGDFLVTLTPGNLLILAQKIVSNGPKHHLHLQEFSIAGESFQKLTAITSTTSIETDSGLDKLDLKINLNSDGSGITIVSPLDPRQIDSATP
jgi:hypothetical protein